MNDATTVVLEQQGKPVSEAALVRRLLKKLTASFASDALWDLIGVAGGFFYVLWPLQKELRKLARRYRNKPDVFLESSLPRLVRKRRLIDPMYDRNFEQFLLFSNRLSAYFREPNPAESANLKLTKHQRRKKAEMLELVGSFVPLPGRVPSDRDGKRIVKLLTELGKTGPGREPDPELQRAIELHEKEGVRGYKRIARHLRPSAPSEEIDTFAKSIADAMRYRRKTST